ncbi:flagellar hook protein FlgL [Pseudidiomarina salinarum]|uniref:Flagellar hook protein FlgL n=1 Tax=Pseudidiomarina salinarum TaxID=435908 RepID=A0A094ITE1_9GAMM|nr:flagellar hook-associated protein FlgL [Pseudidiomarina salinarum]KFZ30945.1 flagellar hook protein FlgL [Pseudidiomarina salinarum]RUO71433.1 flagellar hook-associated protein 3 [Pseudidiomarina salinarum]
MRISTITIYNQHTSSMNKQQADVMKVGQQIASGKRVTTISDDPQAMTQAVALSQSQAVTQQFVDARIGVRNSLGQEESVLNSVTEIYSRAKTLMVQAANGTLGDADRSSVGSELKSLYESLVGLANSGDGNGRYLFGGYQDDTAPFVRQPDGSVSFNGSTEIREQRVDADRLMATGHTGDEIFRQVHSSAGYLVDASPANGGTMTFGAVEILDPSDPQFGQAFDVNFGGTAAAPTYSVNGGAAVAYNAPQDIEVGGLRVRLEGQPAVGDTLRIAPAEQGNTDIFRTFERAITALDTPALTDSDKANLRNTVNVVMNELDNGLDNVLTVRAEVGARFNELDTLDAISANRMIGYKQAMSDLVDLNYVEAASEYSMRMVGLQAAQQSFAKVKDLSLFNYLR